MYLYVYIYMYTIELHAAFGMGPELGDALAKSAAHGPSSFVKFGSCGGGLVVFLSETYLDPKSMHNHGVCSFLRFYYVLQIWGVLVAWSCTSSFGLIATVIVHVEVGATHDSLCCRCVDSLLP